MTPAAIRLLSYLQSRADRNTGRGSVSGPALTQRIDTAVARLHTFRPQDGLFGPTPYYGAFSGGKDSVVIRWLADQCGHPVDWWIHVTTVDPPELIRFVKEHYPDTHWRKPKQTMVELIEEYKIPPLRNLRYCCRVLKETGSKGRVVITGVRRAESFKRSQRRVAEYFNGRTLLNPIVDWSTDEIWQCIRENAIPYCSLYDEGFKRLGCVMCPNSGAEGIARDIARWPKIARRYLEGCNRAYAACVRDGDDIDWIDGTDMFWRWVTGERLRESKEGGSCLMFE
jgi:phosphoadenosine phosphosulfate reductase